MTSKYVLVCERTRGTGDSPGYTIRQRALQEWLTSESDADLSVIFASDNPGSSKIGRLFSILKSARHIRRDIRDADMVIIPCLGSPHMMVLGAIVGLGRSVLFDVCDSVVLTIRSAFRQRHYTRLVITLSQVIAIAMCGRRASFLYIAERDSARDRLLRFGRSSYVVPPPVTGLEGLSGDFKGPPVRIVIPADLSSFHNQQVFRWLLDDINSGRIRPAVPIEVYGPEDPGELPAGMRYMGWAEQLAEVYAGQTAVFAPNFDSAGVQNKVWEAISAGRPVLVGDDAAGHLADSRWVLTFRTRSELPRAFLRLQSARMEECSTEPDTTALSVTPQEILSRTRA